MRNHYEWSYEGSFEAIDVFSRLINWLSGEFTLYQQEEQNGLVVFFPNGSFSVNELERVNGIKFRIIVKSKCLKKGGQIYNQILMTLDLYKKILK